MPAAPTLAAELETFERLRPSLLDRAGDYVAITGDRLIGTFHTFEEAPRAGYAACGIRPFLVKQVLEQEPVLHFTRDLAPCPR